MERDGSEGWVRREWTWVGRLWLAFVAAVWALWAAAARAYSVRGRGHGARISCIILATDALLSVTRVSVFGDGGRGCDRKSRPGRIGRGNPGRTPTRHVRRATATPRRHRIWAPR